MLNVDVKWNDDFPKGLFNGDNTMEKYKLQVGCFVFLHFFPLSQEWSWKLKVITVAWLYKPCHRNHAWQGGDYTHALPESAPVMTQEVWMPVVLDIDCCAVGLLWWKTVQNICMSWSCLGGRGERHRCIAYIVGCFSCLKTRI